MSESLKKNDGDQPWRVFLVDDHPMLLEGLAKLVDQMPQCSVCGWAADAAAALSEIPALMPDLVITDISLPNKSGLELIKDLNSIFPEIKILTFSMHDEMLYAARTLKAGAKGYLMKGANTDLLATAVTRVMQDGIYISAQVSDHLLRNLSSGGTPQSRLQVLTDRELEIFELIGRCQTISQISEQLNISPKTVDAHRGNIKAKLDLADAPSLMREAVLWVELEKEPRLKSGAAGS